MIDPTTITTLRRLLAKAETARAAFEAAEEAGAATGDYKAERKALNEYELALGAAEVAAHLAAPALLEAAEECERMRESSGFWGRCAATLTRERDTEKAERHKVERWYQDAVNTRKAIAAAMSCEPADDADLVEAVRLLVRERDAATARAERAEAALTECSDRLRVTCEQFDAIDPSKADAIATTERARVAEEIAAWLESERRCFCALEGYGLGRHDAANCPKPIDEYEDAATHIRATYCKEPTP